MNIEPIAELIPDGLFKRVAGIEQLAKIATEPAHGFPICYVVPDAETGVPPVEGSYVLHQTIESTVAIVICTHPDGARQGAAAGRLDALEDAVLDALFAKQPDGWDSVLRIADIATISITAGLLARVIRMRGRRHRRTTIQP